MYHLSSYLCSLAISHRQGWMMQLRRLLQHLVTSILQDVVNCTPVCLAFIIRHSNSISSSITPNSLFGQMPSNLKVRHTIRSLFSPLCSRHRSLSNVYQMTLIPLPPLSLWPHSHLSPPLMHHTLRSVRCHRCQLSHFHSILQ